MIELFHVTKRYGAAERPALEDVNLRVDKGEFLLLGGPSGAGKSTLLRLLFCAETASAGQVLLMGKNLARAKRSDIPLLRRKTGVVFQDFKLLGEQTVLENVALALEVQGRSKDAVLRRAKDVLQQVGLSHKLHQAAATLSGGEQQRVAIARALAPEPVLLLCDEPTGNLDPERSKEILELLESAWLRGTTVVVASHDPSLLEAGRHRVVLLQDGRIGHDAPAYRLPPQARVAASLLPTRVRDDDVRDRGPDLRPDDERAA